MWRMLHIMHPPNRCVCVCGHWPVLSCEQIQTQTCCVTSIFHTHLHDDDDDDGSMWPTYVRSLTCTFLLALQFQNLSNNKKKQLLPRSFAHMNIINGGRAHTHARERVAMRIVWAIIIIGHTVKSEWSERHNTIIYGNLIVTFIANEWIKYWSLLSSWSRAFIYQYRSYIADK